MSGNNLRDQLHRAIEKRLAEVNQRYPQSRRALVTALAEVPNPMSVSEIEERLGKSVPVSTIYRNLTILEDAKVVNRLASNDGNGRFELAEEVSGDHHHHLICMNCAKVFDVDLPGSLEQSLVESTGSIVESRDFEVVWHQIDLHGYCKNCRA